MQAAPNVEGAHRGAGGRRAHGGDQQRRDALLVGQARQRGQAGRLAQNPSAADPCRWPAAAPSSKGVRDRGASPGRPGRRPATLPLASVTRRRRGASAALPLRPRSAEAFGGDGLRQAGGVGPRRCTDPAGGGGAPRRNRRPGLARAAGHQRGQRGCCARARRRRAARPDSRAAQRGPLELRHGPTFVVGHGRIQRETHCAATRARDAVVRRRPAARRQSSSDCCKSMSPGHRALAVEGGPSPAGRRRPAAGSALAAVHDEARDVFGAARATHCNLHRGNGRTGAPPRRRTSPGARRGRGVPAVIHDADAQ